VENKVLKNNETITIINKKIFFFHELIQKTILHVQKNKTYDILGVNDVNNCLDSLLFINNKLKEINVKDVTNIESDINELQIVNNEISSLLKIYGTINLDDLLIICFGTYNIQFENDKDKCKFEILQKYFHPVSYKVISIKEVKDNCFIICENNILEKINNGDCFDVTENYKQFHMKVYGMKTYLVNNTQNKCILVYGFMDDVVVDFLNNNSFIKKEAISASIAMKKNE